MYPARANVQGRSCEVQLVYRGPDSAPELRFEKGWVVQYGASLIALTPVEFQMLRLIVEAPREVVSFDDLIQGVWGIS